MASKIKIGHPLTVKFMLPKDIFLWLHAYNKGWTRDDLKETIEELVYNWFCDLEHDFMLEEEQLNKRTMDRDSTRTAY